MGCPESVNNQTIKFAGIVGRITHARSSCARGKKPKVGGREDEGGLGRKKKNTGEDKISVDSLHGCNFTLRSKLF